MTARLRPAQRAALQQLVEDDVLSGHQLAAVLAALGGEADTGRRGTLWEVVGYLGGASALGGAALLVGTRWQDLTHDVRVGLLVAVTLILLGAGTAIGGGPRGLRSLAAGRFPARTRTVVTLHILGAVAAAMTVGTAVDVSEQLNASLAGFVVAALGYVVLPSVPGLLATGMFSVGVVLTGVSELFSSGALAYTVGLAVLGALWVTLVVTGALAERAAGLVLGTLIALAGAQWAVSSDQPWLGYGLTALIAVLCFVVSAYSDDLLIAPGVLGITIAVPEAVWDWTGASLGGPLTVLVCGLTFLVAAGVGLRRSRTHEH